MKAWRCVCAAVPLLMVTLFLFLSAPALPLQPMNPTHRDGSRLANLLLHEVNVLVVVVRVRIPRVHEALSFRCGWV